GE
ncbi:hypothetical protein CP8484711_1134B, partial [Chlamydia psittaci 84-8471/1]